MNYINLERKKIVGRNNQVIPRLATDFDTNTSIDFTFINSNNQILDVPAENGLYFAGSIKMNPTSGELLWLCQDFSIEDKILTFNNVNTYTSGYLANIKKKGTEVNIEIGVFHNGTKEVFLRDFGVANPRVYNAEITPEEIDSGNYYTKSEIDEMISDISGATVGSGILTLTQGETILGTFNANSFEDISINIPAGGGSDVTSSWVNEQISSHDEDVSAHSGIISTKQDKITNDNKLNYSLVSGTPTIPTKTSDLTNDSSFATSSYVDASVSGKQNTITADNKLAYSLVSGTPTIPTKTSDLTNDSFILSSYPLAAANTIVNPEYSTDDVVVADKVTFTNNSSRNLIFSTGVGTNASGVVVAGHDNIVLTVCNSYIAGSTSGMFTINIGCDNTVKHSNSIVIGNENTNSNSTQLLVGNYLLAPSGEGATVIGRYNKKVEGATFTIGVGEGSGNRMNAFEFDMGMYAVRIHPNLVSNPDYNKARTFLGGNTQVCGTLYANSYAEINQKITTISASTTNVDLTERCFSAHTKFSSNI